MSSGRLQVQNKNLCERVADARTASQTFDHQDATQAEYLKEDPFCRQVRYADAKFTDIENTYNVRTIVSIKIDRALDYTSATQP